MEESTFFYILVSGIIGFFTSFSSIWFIFSSVLKEWDEECKRAQALIEPEVYELTKNLDTELKDAANTTGEIFKLWKRRTVTDAQYEALVVAKKEVSRKLLDKIKELRIPSDRIRTLTYSPSAGRDALKILRRNLAILVPFIFIPTIIIISAIAVVATQYLIVAIFGGIYVFGPLISLFIYRPYTEYSNAKEVLGRLSNPQG